MKNIFIINAYPYEENFSSKLQEAYREGARSAGCEVRETNLRELHYNLNLEFGYRKFPELEPDVIKMQEDIAWCNHLVFVYPVWWGTYPALMKGMIDRVFLPGFAFRFSSGKEHEKLLSGKTARLLVSMDGALWTHKYSLGSPGETALKSGTLEFCGIQPVKISYFAEIRKASEGTLQGWFELAKKLGKKAV
jgi:NAD(P)H dehydrogenase (quinone)